MKIPAVRERIRIEGEVGMFLVIWVDQETMTAEVIPLVERNEILSVPFTRVQPLLGDGEFGIVA